MAKTTTGTRCFSPLFFLNPRFILETVTKSATKAANSKTIKGGELEVYMRVFLSFANNFFHLTFIQHFAYFNRSSDKPKREPSAYQIFCKENMKKWNEENPGRAKEAMTQVRFFFLPFFLSSPC